MTDKMINPNELGETVVKVLKTIYDPEIPVDIYELGLIYDVFLNEDNEVKILMTLTTPNCPVAESLPQEVKDKVAEIDGVKNAEVEMTFEPPWSRDLMSEEAKLELGFLQMEYKIINRVSKSKITTIDFNDFFMEVPPVLGI